jgi:hypothetical protein
VDLSGIDDPDLAVVDLLARATLEAQRRGEMLPCRGASPELLWLVRLCGLEEYLKLERNSDPEVVR